MNGTPVRIGVVGTGSLGRHHVRILSDLQGVEFVGIFDTDPETATAVADEFRCRTFSDLESLADEVEAAVVAVPTTDHASVGCLLLDRGIHVLVEKPIAPTLAEADRLVAAAKEAVLAVGHVEYYNPAVEQLLGIEDRPGFVEIHRLAAFTPRSLDVDVVLDLMIHDLQILHALDDSPVAEVRATGISVLSERVDIANSRIALASGCVANLTASRVSAEKVRKLRVFLPSHGYYSVDYQEQEVKGFRLAVVDGERQILPDPLTVVRQEPLRRELEAFVAACQGKEVAYVDGFQGRRALKTALRVMRAIEQVG
jgi:predicted dehydrogenase